jgi:hypothetical protein
MAITITLGALRQAIENHINTVTGEIILSSLNKLANASLSAKLMFHLGDTADSARRIYEKAEKQRVELVKRLGAEDSSGNWKVTPENEQKYFAEYAELLGSTVEIEGRTLTIDELEPYTNQLQAVGLTGNDLKALRWLIVPPEAAEQAKTAAA